MDPLTHGLVGALIARLGPTEKLGSAATAVCAVSAMLPDVDYALYLQGAGAYYCHHRVATHSIVFGLLLCGFVALFANAATGRRSFLAFYGLALAGFLSHLVLDALTPFGTMVFFPFARVRLSGDVLGLVDPWLFFIVFVATAIGFVPRFRARAALFGLALVVGYVGGCAAVRQLAVTRTREEAKGIAGVQRIEVLPVPGLPFAWYGIVDAKAAYYVYEVRGAKTDLVRIVTKAMETRWVQSVRQDEIAAPFFKVARFPVIEDKVDEAGHHIQVHDLGLELATGRRFFILKADTDETEQVVQIRVLLKDDAEPGR